MKTLLFITFIFQHRFIGQLDFDLSQQDTWRLLGGLILFVLLFYYSWYKRKNKN